MKNGGQHAEGNEGRPDLPGDQAQDGRQGEGSADSAGQDGAQPRHGKKAKVPPRTNVIALDSINKQLLPTRIKRALKESSGNLVLAAVRLETTVAKLDREIRLSQQLCRFVHELKNTAGPYIEYRKMSLSEVEEDIRVRSILYRSQALDALNDLAMMPIGENSALAQVKLLAAQRLYAETGDSKFGNEIDQTLRRLNEDYHLAAPRIKSIRERTVTFESGNRTRVIEAEPSAPSEQ